MAKPQSHQNSHPKSSPNLSAPNGSGASTAANKPAQNAPTPRANVNPRPASSPKLAEGSAGVLPEQILRDSHTKRSASTLPKPSPRVRPGIWLGATLGILLLVAGGAAAGAYSRFASSDAIAPNVFIAGVPVGGLTVQAAKSRLVSHFGSPRVSLLCDGKSINVPISTVGAQLSITPTVQKAYAVGRDGLLPKNLLRVCGSAAASKDFMIPIVWNKKQLVNGLRRTNKKVAVAPVDARLQAGDYGLDVIADHPGTELNVGAAAHLLQSKFYVGMPSLHVPLRSVEAHIRSADLAGEDTQLAQYTTSFNPGLAGRTQNLRIASRAIQNHVLMPGETFSFNACTGERTLDKGYRMAHIFLRQPGATESEVVEGLAGGVCQVSSTLFNAVRKTNAQADVNPIKIVERTTHSLPVTYVPRGLDATVAWPYKDLKFRNVTDRPIYVHTEMGRSKLTISVWTRLPQA